METPLGAFGKLLPYPAPPLTIVLAEAQKFRLINGEAASYASHLAGLTATTNLGNITLKKNQSLTSLMKGAARSLDRVGGPTGRGDLPLSWSAQEKLLGFIDRA